MKVVSSKIMAHIETCAYAEGFNEVEFMEAAGRGVALAVADYIREHKITPEVVLFCGKGNNGGDGYVAGCHLLEEGYRVQAFQVGTFAQCSPLCQKNSLRFQRQGGVVIEAQSAHDVALPVDGVVVDALLGTGVHGAPRSPFSTIIERINASQLPVVAVDIPSGLDGDSGEVAAIAIRASITVFLGLPKTGFFLDDGWNYVGKLRYVDFGLPQKQVEEAESSLEMTTLDYFASKLPPLKRNRHKYEAGYVVGIAGSPGMPGAANLAATAALNAGAGIVRLLHPQGMEAELSSSIYELIKTPYTPVDSDNIIETVNSAQAAFIGPGMGTGAETRRLLAELLPQVTVPAVLDADALNVLAEEKIALPKDVVMTPHIGEMHRLLGKPSCHEPLTFDFLERCRGYAEEKGVTLIVKGGPSFIITLGRSFVVNPSGDPGMATAGSGDVLTGVVAAMIAQGLSIHDAAVAAAYFHGLAGEYAACEKTSYCMTASDIIAHFPDVFRLALRT